ncbi:MAG TPA: hypothetical protein VNM24_02245 [Burkholderiales bacterium]|jgi:hypothetical protein|nr:hypothetical protein [Burkholderiales bacterium]
MRFAIALLAALLLASCATTYSLVEPARHTVRNVLSVEPGMKWNKMGSSGLQGNVEVWTLDGPALNTLVFFTGVNDGEPLLASRAIGHKQEEKPPVFHSTMNPLEIQELMQAAMARHFQSTLAETHNLRTQAVAETKGFRFQTRLVGRDEVERHGVFAGAVSKGKLYGLWFQGAKLHYFDRYLPEYERILASAKLIGPAAP